MKNRFLTTFLALAAIAAFTHTQSTQQPTKAELLAHLHNVKAEITEIIQNYEGPIIPEDKKSEQQFALNIINEFYDSSDLLQQNLSNQIDNDFSLLCNNMINFNQLPHNITYVAPTFDKITKTQLYQTFEAIFAKLHPQYCINNPNGCLISITAQDIFEEILEVIFYIKELEPWLQKIDTKIAELK